MPDPGPVPRLSPGSGEDRRVNIDSSQVKSTGEGCGRGMNGGGASWEDRGRVDTSLSGLRACSVGLNGIGSNPSLTW